MLLKKEFEKLIIIEKYLNVINQFIWNSWNMIFYIIDYNFIDLIKNNEKIYPLNKLKLIFNYLSINCFIL